MNHSEHIGKGYILEDPQDFARLYQEMYGALSWFAERFLENREEAQDVVGEVFFKLWNSKTELRAIDSLPAYLRKMTANECLNFLKRNKLKHRIYRELLSRAETITEADFARCEIKSEVIDFFNSELQQLSPKYQQVFNLSFVEGLKNEEIAQCLHTSNKSVRVIKFKLRKMLKAKIVSPVMTMLIIGLFLPK